jgi:hypothetical protein
MTKFGNIGKTRGSGFLFRTVQIRQFQNMNMTGAKLEDWKILGILMQEKGLKGIKRPR